MKEQQELLNFIEVVFSQTIPPGMDKIYENERCRIEFIEYLGQSTWQETKLDKLIYRDEIVISLGDDGFLYYLPAFLHFMLVSYNDMDVLRDSVIDRLTPKLNNMNVPRASWVKNIYDHLTEPQREYVNLVTTLRGQPYTQVVSVPKSLRYASSFQHLKEPDGLSYSSESFPNGLRTRRTIKGTI